MSIDKEIPFSLYLSLEQGSLADLQVVSEASIELIAAIKEVAAFIDPTAQIRITMQNGEKGSLKINSFLKILLPKSSKEEDKKSHWRGVGIGLMLSGLVSWIPAEIGSHYLGKALDALDSYILEALKDEASDADISEIQTECREITYGILRNRSGSQHIEKFYSTLMKDDAIIGVGVSPKHNKVPLHIIPRDEFADRSRASSDVEESETRIRVEDAVVILIQPRLTPEKRKWRFSVDGKEFAAYVLDEQFLLETLSGAKAIPLQAGLSLNVTLEVNETKVGNYWRIDSRNINKVHEVIAPRRQESFL